MKQAAASVGIADSTLIEWSNRGRDYPDKYPDHFEFHIGIKKSQQAFKIAHLQNIARAATEPHETLEVINEMLPDGTQKRRIMKRMSPPDWKASAWLLERVSPGEFARRIIAPEDVPADTPKVIVEYIDAGAPEQAKEESQELIEVDESS